MKCRAYAYLPEQADAAARFHGIVDICDELNALLNETISHSERLQARSMTDAVAMCSHVAVAGYLKRGTSSRQADAHQ